MLNCFRTRRKTSLRVLFVAPVVCPPAGLSSPLTDSVLISGVEIGGDRDELFSGVGTSDAFNPDDIIVIGGCRPRICLRSISGDVFVLFKVPFVWLWFLRRFLGDGKSLGNGDTCVVVGLSATCIRSSNVFERILFSL